MKDVLFFNGFETSLKSMESVKSEERYFEGLLTVQMKDKQGEITIVDELYKVLPIWMDRGAPISDTHSNRIIGKGINYSRTIVKNENGEELPAIKITGKIFKNYELDNLIWEKIKNQEYKGLSFGGATRTNRTPVVMKDGSIAYALKDLEHYEVAVCKDPAVPMALITDFNPLAKAMTENITERGDKMVIQCSKFGCYVEKAEIPEGVELNKPIRTEGEEKKFKVYVKDPSTGKVVIVRFGDPNMEIKRDDDERRESFRARHDCENAKDITTPQYWSCKMWEKETSVSEYTEKSDDVIKANLAQYRTFEEKVQALIKEGYSEKSAKKIVGSFVKDEKTKTGEGSDGGTVTTSTNGVNNPVHNGKKKINLDISNTGATETNMYRTMSQAVEGGAVRNNLGGTVKQGGLEEEQTNEIKRSQTKMMLLNETLKLQALSAILKRTMQNNINKKWEKNFDGTWNTPTGKKPKELDVYGDESNLKEGVHYKQLGEPVKTDQQIKQDEKDARAAKRRAARYAKLGNTAGIDQRTNKLLRRQQREQRNQSGSSLNDRNAYNAL